MLAEAQIRVLQEQVARGCPPLYGSPATLRLLGRVLHNLDDFAEMPAPGSIHNDVFADAHTWDGGGIEMVNFAYFGETYTNNVSIHAANYTVSSTLGWWWRPTCLAGMKL